MTSADIKQKLKTNWGFSYFVLVSLLTFPKLLKAGSLGHYHVFTSAAQAIWHQQPAYFTDFGWGNGLEWFYSPSCALLFYLPFSFLPDTLGVLLNVGFMWIIFTAAALYFMHVTESKGDTESTVKPFNLKRAVLTPSPVYNFFWFMVGSEMIGAIASQKTEIFMIAICFFACAQLIVGRWKWPAFLLAMITNWKFQPIPLVGLFTIGDFLTRRRVQFLAVFVIWSIAFLALPVVIFGSSATQTSYSSWMSAVQTQMQTKWFDFDHVYNILRKVFGLGITIQIANLIGAVTGLGFVVLHITHFVRHRAKRDVTLESFLFAFALAATFMTSFSPLSQSNGYILAAPLVAVLAVCYSRFATSDLERRVIRYGLGLGWVLTSLLTSDLVPKLMRNYWRDNALKSLGPLVMLIVIAWFFLRPRNAQSPGL